MEKWFTIKRSDGMYYTGTLNWNKDLISALFSKDREKCEEKASNFCFTKGYAEVIPVTITEGDFENPLKQLKAENERLKDARRFETKASNKKTQDMFNKWANDVRDLQQQLKDKENENTLLKDANRKFYEKVMKVKSQVCKKIKEFIEKPENSIFWDASIYVETEDLRKLLDQIEKGVDNENN